MSLPTTTHGRPWTVLAALLPALAAAAGAAPQEPATDARFGERVDVQLVNVEVWVTDRDGEHVPGLGIEAFEVREDGRRVEITHFAEIHDGRSVPRTAPVTAPEATTEPAAAAAEGPYLVLYFDDLHLGPRGRGRLVEDLRGLLASGAVAPENVLVMRQTLDLYTEAAFGSDPEALDAALSRQAKPAPEAMATAQEKRLAVAELQRLWEQAKLVAGGPDTDPCFRFLRRALQTVQNFAEVAQIRTRATIDHLSAVAGFLAGLPGGKTLIYMSDLLETVPGTDLLSFIQGVCPEGHTEIGAFMPPERLSVLFGRLTRHASTNRVTIYTLQASGLRTGFTRTAESQTLDFAGGDPLAQAIRTHERDGLVQLALETGGRAIFNRNAFGPELAAIGREMNSYYSLAYAPPHVGDGGRHEIKVRVAGDGLRVRHRRGYRDKSAAERLEERLEGAIHLGLMENPLEARLGAGTLEAAGEDRYRLSLHVLIPVERVTFLPVEGGDMASLTVRVLGRDGRNRRRADDARTYDVARPPREIDTLDLVLPLEIRGGAQVLAVGVRDDATRTTSYLSTTLEITDPEGR